MLRSQALLSRPVWAGRTFIFRRRRPPRCLSNSGMAVRMKILLSRPSSVSGIDLRVPPPSPKPHHPITPRYTPGWLPGTSQRGTSSHPGARHTRSSSTCSQKEPAAIWEATVTALVILTFRGRRCAGRASHGGLRGNDFQVYSCGRACPRSPGGGKSASTRPTSRPSTSPSCSRPANPSPWRCVPASDSNRRHAGGRCAGFRNMALPQSQIQPRSLFPQH